MKKRDLTDFGVTVKKRLVELGITQKELAAAVGVGQVYLNIIIHGQRTGNKYIGSICEYLDIQAEPSGGKRLKYGAERCWDEI